MKIPVILNGEITVLEADPALSLLKVLRREGIISAKLGCTTGRCDSCTVLVGGRAVASCLIPLAAVRDATIITLEYFSKTPEYKVIIEAFGKAGIKLCGYCNAGKILATYSLISTHKHPSLQLVQDTVRHFNCSCTEQDDLVQGIMYAGAAFQTQSGQRSGRSKTGSKTSRNSRNGRNGKK